MVTLALMFALAPATLVAAVTTPILPILAPFRPEWTAALAVLRASPPGPATRPLFAQFVDPLPEFLRPAGRPLEQARAFTPNPYGPVLADNQLVALRQVDNPGVLKQVYFRAAPRHFSRLDNLNPHALWQLGHIRDDCGPPAGFPVQSPHPFFFVTLVLEARRAGILPFWSIPIPAAGLTRFLSGAVKQMVQTGQQPRLRWPCCV